MGDNAVGLSMVAVVAAVGLQEQELCGGKEGQKSAKKVSKRSNKVL